MHRAGVVSLARCFHRFCDPNGWLSVELGDGFIGDGDSIVRGYTEIRSLTAGYVVERLVSPGTLVTAGTPILRIAQLDIVRVHAFVGDKDLTDIRLGTPVTVPSPKDGKVWSA